MDGWPSLRLFALIPSYRVKIEKDFPRARGMPNRQNSWRYKCSESDPCLLAEILIILSPAASALANGCVVVDKLDRADVPHHGEAKLRFDTKSEGRSVQNRQRTPLNGLWTHTKSTASITMVVSRHWPMW